MVASRRECEIHILRLRILRSQSLVEPIQMNHHIQWAQPRHITASYTRRREYRCATISHFI